MNSHETRIERPTSASGTSFVTDLSLPRHAPITSQRSKRVLVVAYLFPPVGGAGVQRIAKFVKYLPDFGWTPTVLTAANPSVPLFDDSLTAEIPATVRLVKARTLEPGYALKRTVSSETRQAAGRIPSMTTFLKRLLRRMGTTLLQPDPQILWYPDAVRKGLDVLQQEPHDAILVTAPPFSSFLVGAALSRRSGLPLLLDYRDEWDISNAYWENKQHGTLTRAWQTHLQQRVIGQASLLIATTNASAQSLSQLASHRHNPPRVTHIYNGYDTNDFLEATEAIANASEPSRCRMAYVGTLWNLTSVEPLVRGIQSLADQAPELVARLDLVLAGRRTEPQEQFLQCLESLPCRLERLDYLDHAAAVRMMCSSDALCLLLSDVPHAGRVVPAKLFEYMAAQRPILYIGPEGEVSDLLQQYPLARVCRPDDTTGIVQALAGYIQQHQPDAAGSIEVARRVTRFERRNLTSQLAEWLDTTIETRSETKPDRSGTDRNKTDQATSDMVVPPPYKPTNVRAAQSACDAVNAKRHCARKRSIPAFVSLMYHNVIPDGAKYPSLSPSVTSYFVERTAFEQQVRLLVDRAACLTFQQITSCAAVYGTDSSGQASCSVTAPSPEDANTRRQMSEPPTRGPWIHISFDDGWLGSVEEAGPVLEQHGCSATLFITTDLIGKSGFISRRQLNRLDPATFSIGSHARSHRPLAQLTTKAIREELSASKHVLEEITGHEVDALSLPGGSVDDRVRAIAAELGYRFLFTSRVCRNQFRKPRPGSFFGGYLRGLWQTWSPKNVPDPLNLFEIGRIAIKGNTSRRQFDQLLQHRLGRAQAIQQMKQLARTCFGQTLYARIRAELLHESTQQQEMTDLTSSQASSVVLAHDVSWQGDD